MFLIDKNHNPSVETKPDPRSIEGLIAWLETMPSDKAYCYISGGMCLIAQYLTHLGIEFTRVIGLGDYYATEQDSRDRKRTKTTEAIWNVARTMPWTFGAALDRARAYQAKVRT